MNINIQNLKEIIDPLIQFFKFLTTFVMGYLTAKKNDKINELEAQNKELNKYQEIDKQEVTKEQVYNAKEWK